MRQWKYLSRHMPSMLLKLYTTSVLNYKTLDSSFVLVNASLHCHWNAGSRHMHVKPLAPWILAKQWGSDFFFNKSRRCDSNGQPCHHSCKIEIDPVAFLSISPVPSCFVDLFVSSRWAWSGETGTLQTPIQGMLLWSTPLYSLSENLGDSCSFHLILSRPLGACAPRLLDYFFLLWSLHSITVA